MKWLLASVVGAAAAPAAAHEGESHAGWTLDLWVTGPLALSAILYLTGFLRLKSRVSQGAAKLNRQGMLFTSGWLVLAAAAVSPLHEAGERSFTMHMIEHEIIMLLAALLLVLSRPGAAMLWGLPAGVRGGVGRLGQAGPAKSLWRWLTRPFVATILQGLALWLWHVPALFDRALADKGWHIAQHLSFLITALIFWWAMVHGRMGRSGYAISAICLFLTAMIGGALGALMALSSSPWYSGYAAMGMTPYGLSPAEDQQLAGILMWVPGGLVHMGAAILLLHSWLKANEASGGKAAE